MTDDTSPNESRSVQECCDVCRQVGFDDGRWFYDVRAGYCKLETLQPTDIIVTTEHGRAIAIGTAVDLYDWYQDGSIYPIDPAALANARAVVLAAAQRQVDLALQDHERDDPWPHSEHVTTIADLAAVVHVFEQATEHDCSIDTILD